MKTKYKLGDVVKLKSGEVGEIVRLDGDEAVIGNPIMNMEQAEMEKFVLEQTKYPVEEAIARFRKLKFELGEKPFKVLLRNSKAWLKTYDRYIDYLMK